MACAPLFNSNFNIKRVQRIQNTILLKRYQTEKELMELAHVGQLFYNVNEKHLYHVSSAPKQVIASEGLDQRMSREGFFGNGIYFSDNPKKCDHYFKRASPKYMFRCKVLLGDSKEYPPRLYDRTLKREPNKEPAFFNHLSFSGNSFKYDSVKGNVTGHTEYVVYNQNRVFPEYVIEYESNG